MDELLKVSSELPSFQTADGHANDQDYSNDADDDSHGQIVSSGAAEHLCR